MRSFDEIVSIVNKRRAFDSVVIREAIAVRDRYNGDFTIPLIDVDGDPIVPRVAPALIADSIDNTAKRAAASDFVIAVPALDPAKERGKRSIEYADIRKRFYYAVCHESDLKQMLYRAYRHLAGYASVSLLVMPDGRKQMPLVKIRDPLTTYPAPRSPEDSSPPTDVAFVYGKSTDALLADYPEARQIVGDVANTGVELWDCVEWVDEDYIVIGLLGPREPNANPRQDARYGMEFRRYPNRAGMVPAAIGRRPTLDRIKSQVSNIVGMTDFADRMAALEAVAAERAVFPDRYVIGREGQPPQIVGGVWRDGRQGQVNQLIDVQQVGELQSMPGPQTFQTMSMLERAARLSGGNPGLYSGELTGSLRSGQTINALGGFSIDPTVAELQVVMEAQLSTVLEAIHHVAKGYYPNKTFSLYSGWSTDRGHVDYTPEVHGETAANVVSYPLPGSNVSETTVIAAQAVGARMMSLATARAIHPYITDADFEGEQIELEAIDAAILQGFLAQSAQPGGMQLPDLARVRQLRAEGVLLADALLKVQQEAQARQATPTEPGAPEAQPGIAPPGQGAEAGTGAAPAAQGAPNLEDVFNAMRTPSNIALIGNRSYGAA